jgi:cell division protein FtsL
MEEIIKLKADAYDVALEIEQLEVKLKEAKDRKKTIDTKIETLAPHVVNAKSVKIPTTPAELAKANELRMKEQKIIEARLGKIGGKGRPAVVLNPEPEDEDE